MPYMHLLRFNLVFAVLEERIEKVVFTFLHQAGMTLRATAPTCALLYHPARSCITMRQPCTFLQCVEFALASLLRNFIPARSYACYASIVRSMIASRVRALRETTNRGGEIETREQARAIETFTQVPIACAKENAGRHHKQVAQLSNN